MIKKFKIFDAVRWYYKGKLDGPEEFNAIEHDDFITDDEFRRFLIENGAYENYIKNCENFSGSNFISNFHEYDKRDFIDLAFTWSRTPEGQRYWLNLESKWHEHIAAIGEAVKWYYKGKFENDSEEDYSDYTTLDKTGFEAGYTVICVKDSINNPDDRYPERLLPIKAGEKKIVKGGGTRGYFIDTPGGWGSYPINDFAKIEE